MGNDNKKKHYNSEPERGRRRVKYSLLTFVLLICIVELSFSAMQNINKNINFTSKIHGLENKKNEELIKNNQLKSEIKNFNSELTLESIARNTLKMAGKDEILIIISKPEDINQGEVKANNLKKDKNK